MAVYTGPETDALLSEVEKEEQAKASLGNMKEAELLMETNYVYATHKGRNKPDFNQGLTVQASQGCENGLSLIQ